VGVRHIAHHCTKIKHLNLSGIYLLTDGMKRDFGLEGIQALSVAAPDLTYLHLVGCFQVPMPHLNPNANPNSSFSLILSLKPNEPCLCLLVPSGVEGRDPCPR